MHIGGIGTRRVEFNNSIGTAIKMDTDNDTPHPFRRPPRVSSLEKILDSRLRGND